MRLPPLCLLFALGVGLAACTSTAPAIHHYTLGGSSAEESIAKRPGTPLVLVLAPQLAEYLRQSYLVMQTGEHQLEFAQRHVWSQSLRSAIPDRLTQALNARDPDRVYITGDDPRAGKANLNLRLRVRDFLPTHRSEVKLLADYWFVDAGGETLLSRTANLRQPLEADGYAQAVAQMETLLVRLAESVADDAASLAKTRE